MTAPVSNHLPHRAFAETSARWGLLTAICGVISLVVAILAWLLPRSPDKPPQAADLSPKPHTSSIYAIPQTDPIQPTPVTGTSTGPRNQPPASRRNPVESYIGQWTGYYDQPNSAYSKSYRADMTIDGTGGIGSRIGVVSYPSQPCSTKLVLREATEAYLVADEIVEGDGSKCIDGTTTITVHGSTLAIKWIGVDGGVATGELKKVK